MSNRTFKFFSIYFFVAVSIPKLLYGDVIINEIMYRPSTLQSSEEYIELFNPTEDIVDISKWTLSEGISYTFPSGTTILPNSYVVVSASPQAFANLYEDIPSIGPFQGKLSNSGESIALQNSNGDVIERVFYKDEQGWPDMADGHGPSLERLHPQMPANYFHSWWTGPPNGTPGSANQSFIRKPFPIIWAVHQNPIIPTSQDSVLVTAWIDSTQPASSVILYYKSEDQSFFSFIPMVDDGLGNDPIANDQQFTAEIPPYESGTVVEFYIEATDSYEGVGRYPYRKIMDNSIYRVDETEYPSNTIPMYRIIMRTEDEAELRTRDPFSDIELDSTFIAYNQIFYNVGIRFRGRGARSREPKSYRLNFSRGNLFGNIRKLNLNGYHPERQFIGLEVFRQLGMPVPSKQMVSLSFNGVYYPAYLQVERADKDMMDRLFEDGSGNLYRGEHQANLDYRGEDPTAYYAHYLKKTNELEGDYQDIIRLSDAFTNSSQADFVSAIDKHIQIRQWIRWFAIKEFINDREGGLSLERGDDYYIYHHPLDDLFYLIPWDLDSVLDDYFEPVHHHGTPAVRRLLQHPDLARFYYQELVSLLYHEMPLDRMESIIRMTSPIASEEDQNKLLQRHAGMRDFLIASIPQNLTVDVQEGNSEFTVIIPGDSEWKYYRGWTQPLGGQLDWTFPNYDDSLWETGIAGFGYGDSDDRTVLDDMEDNYTTVFIRKSFEIPPGDSYSKLFLTVRYDDAFVAYLNGQEIARENFEGIPLFDSEALHSHESDYPYPIFEIDPQHLQEGKNTLAIVGINVRSSSSDFSLEAQLTGTLSSSDVITLSGYTNAAHTRFVQVNGVESTFTPWQGTWSSVQELKDGKNGFTIHALDANHQIIDSTSIVLYKNASQPEDYFETANHDLWVTDNSPYNLSKTLYIPESDSLTIGAGVIVRFPQEAGIVVDGTLTILGSEDSPVLFEALDPLETWGGIAINPGAGEINIQHATFTQSGELSFRENIYPAAIYINNSSVCISHVGFENLAGAIDAKDATLTVRSSCFNSIAEGIHCNHTYSLVEDNLFYQHKGYHDAIDFDFGTDQPSIIRNNRIIGSEDDGIDLGFADAIISGNWIEQCEDKALSLEGQSYVQLFNNVIVDNNLAIAIKDSCSASIVHNTIVDVTTAIAVYEKNSDKGGGHADIINTIIWNTENTIDLDALSTATVEHSNVENLDMLWQSQNNMSLEPLFLDIASRDFHLKPNSPLIDKGFPTNLEYDFEHQSRYKGSAPDIGAYESEYDTRIPYWDLFE